MPNRAAFVALLLSGVLGCGGSESSTPPNTSPVKAVDSGAPTSSASASSPPADAVSSAPVDEPVKVDARAVMARLPQRAAIYGWARPAAADTVVGWSSGGRLKRNLATVFPDGSVTALVRALGVATGAPIALSISAPDRTPVEKILKALAAGKRLADVESDVNALPSIAMHIRIVAQARPNGDALKKIAAWSSDMKLEAVPCPGRDLCGLVGKDAKLVVASPEGWMGIVYQEGSQLEVDLVRHLTPEKTARVAAAVHGVPTGGAKEGQCTRLDAEADLSLCVDPDQAGELGAALGMFMTFEAVAGSHIDPKSLAAITKEGMAESMRNVELANPKRRLLDDGTVSLRVSNEGFQWNGSWQLTKASRPGVETKLGDPCVAPSEIVSDWIPKLVAALGDRGPEFAKFDDSYNRLREAGGPGYLVLLGRTWPNFLGALPLKELRLSKLTAPLTKVCALSQDGRLEIKVAGRAFPLDKL